MLQKKSKHVSDASKEKYTKTTQKLAFCYVKYRVMIAAVTPAAYMHPAATITRNTVSKCNITTAKEAPLFNRAEIHF